MARAFSPLCSLYINREGVRSGMILGCVLYTIGLLCRAFPNHLLLALFSGAMTGLGLSLADLVQQTLLLMMDDQQRQRSLFWSNQPLTVARSAGVFLSGWLFLLFDLLLNNPYQGILLLSALVAFQALWIVPSTQVIFHPDSSAAASSPSYHLRELFSVHRWLTIQFVGAIFLIGFNLTVLLPYYAVKPGPSGRGYQAPYSGLCCCSMYCRMISIGAPPQLLEK